jgi:hypothetical protein
MRPSIAFIRRAPKPSWVGFDGSFGVKGLGLWAVESGLPPISNGGKRFKWLNKLLEKG